jgi:LPS sulfotransferase NodH
MFHIGRCGSTVVANLLSQHRNILWANELYEPIFKQWDRVNPDFTQPDTMPVPPIEYLQQSLSKANGRNYGFEIKPYHFRLIGVLPEKYLEDIQYLDFLHFILLDRKNKLRKIISSLKAKKTGVYHLKTGSEAQLEKIHIPINNIKIDHESKSLVNYIADYCNDVECMETMLNTKKNYLSLTYEEDIEKNPLVAYSKICQFIGIKTIDPKISLAKTTPFPLKDLIENFDEVARCLESTPYKWMLKD